MNSSQNTNMSPNTFRHLLVAHGRTTTPGVFDASILYKSDDILKEIIDKKKNEMCVKDKDESCDKEILYQKPVVVESDHVRENFLENFWPRKEALVNPPLSKSKSTKPTVASSYSFYTRPFKVHGREAWEFAMRGLGSVDTLMNRYGYVEPMWRGEIHRAPLEAQLKETAITKNEAKDVKSTKEENNINT